MAKKPILSALKNFSPVFGRMNTIPNRFGFRVVIDFAHTPNGLKNALTALRKNTGGRLIAVFGCAGLRDSAKRPLMGKISGQRADITVITAEDPRTEDINQINQSIAAGLSKAGVIKINPLKFACLKPGSKKKVYFIINDRQQAINFAIRKIAAKGDTVGIFGKGHEQSMCFCTKEYPWSDHEAVKKALKR